MSGSAQKIERPQRWSIPFADELEGAEMDEDLAAHIVREHLSPLVDDRAKFPPNLPLESIVRNDTRLRRYREGEIVVRRGDYGNSAFQVLRGGVHLLLKHLPDDQLGRRPSGGEGLLRTVARVFSRRPRQPEVRVAKGGAGLRSQASHRIDLQDFPEFLAAEPGADGRPAFDPNCVKTQRGEIFGELAALGRIPRSTTVVAAGDDTVLLEIRWQALRDIRRFSPAWKAMIDDRYRRYSLHVHLREARYTSNLVDGEEGGGGSDFEAVTQLTQFHSYGDFEWGSDFRALAGADSAARLAGEATIVSQGNQPNGLTMVRSGFVRVRRRYNYGEKTVSYLGKGQSYGLAEIYHNWKKRMLGGSGREEILTFQHTLSAVGYADTLFIPTPVVEKYIIPKLTADDQRELEETVESWPGAGPSPSAPPGAGGGREAVPPAVLEFLVEQRAINGSAAMLIDLDRCTRCDDCVQACASVHDGNPRFIRHGPQSGGVQLTHACMHCADPVCMIGCPTGAIHRDEAGDQVVINDLTCIGCSTCADNCPYHNIQMVEIRDPSGDFVPGTHWDPAAAAAAWDDPAEPPIRKATKCDLCESLPTGPACANACPHDALVRIDLRETAPIETWLNRR